MSFVLRSSSSTRTSSSDPVQKLDTLHLLPDPLTTALIKMRDEASSDGTQDFDLIKLYNLNATRDHASPVVSSPSSPINIQPANCFVDRIPPEILAEIFAWTLPSGPVLLLLTDRRCPWTLRMVCNRWRAVALSTPSLWSYFNFDLDLEASAQSFCGSYRLLELFLLWSRRHALKLVLNVIGKHWELFWYLIFTQAFRFEALDLRINHESVHILHTFRGFVPRLRKLSLRLCGGLRSNLIPVDKLRDAPRLRSFSVMSDYRSPPLAINFGWSQLKQLRCEIDYLGQVEKYSRGARNIIEWYMVVSDPIPGTSRPPCSFNHQVKLPRLRSLVYKGDWRILDGLVLPSLETLEVIQFVNHRHFHIDIKTHFSSLISRSSCTLQSLTLKYSSVHFEDRSLVDMLSCTPSLLHLTLVELLGITGGTLFHAMRKHRLKQQPILPGLRTFAMAGMESVARHPYFVAMVESRISETTFEGVSVAALESVKLRFVKGSHMKEDILFYKSMDRLHKQGAHLHVYYMDRYGKPDFE